MENEGTSSLESLSFIENVDVEGDILTLIISGEEFTVHAPEYPRGTATAKIRGKDVVLKPGSMKAYAKEVWDLINSGDFPRTDSDRQESYIQGAPEPCSAFLRDVEEMKRIYGPKSVSFTQVNAFVEGTYRAKVDLNLDPAPLLSSMIAECYGVDRKSPIILRLTITDISSYNEMRDTLIDCLQTTRKSPLAAQLQRIFRQPGRLLKIWDQDEVKTKAPIRHAKSGSSPASDPICSTRDDVRRQQDVLQHILAGEDIVAGEQEDAAKDIPKRTNGFLVQLMQYAIARIKTISTYCVICDLPHIFAGGSMLKPAVCSREICAFAFHALKTGSDAADEIATDSGVIDLLVCMLKAAAFSTRTNRIMTPFPQIVDPADPKKLVLNPKEPDTAKLKSILQNFPSVCSLSQANDIGDIKRKLDSINPLAFPLMQWTVSSNRSHIVKLRKEDHLPTMWTQHQYMLLTAPPDKQAKFAALKAKHGSKFAFHGSNIENWHCILHTGLKNASGTDLQLNGTAHGSGIYFAPTANTSIGYCKTSGSGGARKESEGKASKDGLSEHFINERNMICLALCEIINLSIKDHGWCWTLEDEDHCMTRFFFVYEQNNTGSAGSADTKTDKFLQEIKEALGKHSLE